MTDLDLFGNPIAAKRASLGTHESAVGGTDEWCTPKPVVDALGPFDLDPCSPINRPWPTAATHYTIADDGLRQDWGGVRVWCNPPYATSGPWLARMATNGNGIALIFARTETRIWHEHVWPHAHGFLFLKGRLTFHTTSGRPAPGNAGAPSVLIAYSQADATLLRSRPLAGAYVETKGATDG